MQKAILVGLAIAVGIGAVFVLFKTRKDNFRLAALAAFVLCIWYIISQIP